MRTKNDNFSPVPVRLPNDWIDELKKISEKSGLSTYSELIRVAVKKYIDEYKEDQEFGEELQSALKSGKVSRKEIMDFIDSNIS
jgi:metal-responsive CopG/Arc/MetJ family transcriptional regulator